jgi:ribonuclease HI
MKRFFAIDHDAYESGALPKATKELLGLVASTVLRCDDCIRYHVAESISAGVTVEQLVEALGIALVVGGSITIPHVRRAFEILDSIEGSG